MRSREQLARFLTRTGDTHRGKHDENAVATCDGALDDLAVVGRSRYDRDALLEDIELLHAAVAAHADDLVAAIQGVLHHVLPELSGSPDDADLLHARSLLWVDERPRSAYQAVFVDACARK